LKIFLSFLQSEKNYPIPAYSFWQYYIKNGIEEAGHSWSECPDADWALGLVPQTKEEFAKWKEQTWSKTAAWLKKNPPDIFLSYLYPDMVDITAIKEIQRSGIPCVNFFCDHVREIRKIPVEFGVFNYSWVPEFKALKLYIEAGYSYIHLPMPMWVAPEYRVLKDESIGQVTFIGSKDMQRILLLEELVKLAPDIDLAVYGNGWKEQDIPQYVHARPYTLKEKIRFNLNYVRDEGIMSFARKIRYRHMTYDTALALSAKTHPSPAFEMYNKLIAESMISLGINRYESFDYPLLKPNSYSRLRDIEAPMLGACYLTEYTEGMEELYDTENEIMVYNNAEELLARIKHLQADPGKRRQMKINGQKRALQDHTISNSLRKIISMLN
jgi:glycosyltransferase involved in cell wall biosynthesis